MTGTTTDIAAMSFEDALGELERIVENLERGDVPLDRSIAIYERGEALKAHCAWSPWTRCMTWPW